MTSAAAAPPQSGFQSVALISAPWPFFSRPSIQLGTLKAYLKRALPDLRIDAHHFYLKLAAEIGYDTYHGISERSWLAESVYATLLYPQRQAAARKLFESEARKVARLRRVNFEALCGKVKKLTDHWITSVEWQKTGVGRFFPLSLSADRQPLLYPPDQGPGPATARGGRRLDVRGSGPRRADGRLSRDRLHGQRRR